MRTIFTGLLVGLAACIAGCNSHDANQAHSDSRPAAGRSDARVAPAVSSRVVNQAAGQAIEVVDRTTIGANNVIDTAAATADRTVNQVNRTAATIKNDAQQATTDAATLTNDAARTGNKLLNNAARDANQLNDLVR